MRRRLQNQSCFGIAVFEECELSLVGLSWWMHCRKLTIVVHYRDRRLGEFCLDSAEGSGW
jgi:hypothetical protein